MKVISRHTSDLYNPTSRYNTFSEKLDVVVRYALHLYSKDVKYVSRFTFQRNSVPIIVDGKIVLVLNKDNMPELMLEFDTDFSNYDSDGEVEVFVKMRLKGEVLDTVGYSFSIKEVEEWRESLFDELRWHKD